MNHNIKTLAQRLATPQQLNDLGLDRPAAIRVQSQTPVPAPTSVERLKPSQMVPKPAPKVLTYESAKEELKDIFWERLHVERAFRKDPNFNIKWTPDQKRTFDTLIKYFVGDPSCELELHKGIWLYGPPGHGKTELMKMFERLCVGTTKAFEYDNFETRMIIRREDKEYPLVTLLIQGNRVLDDIAFSSPSLNHYGDRINMLQDVLYRRHDRFLRYYQTTHCITNCSPKELGELTNAAIASRAKQMIQPVLWVGEDFRPKQDHG